MADCNMRITRCGRLGPQTMTSASSRAPDNKKVKQAIEDSPLAKVSPLKEQNSRGMQARHEDTKAEKKLAKQVLVQMFQSKQKENKPPKTNGRPPAKKGVPVDKDASEKGLMFWQKTAPKRCVLNGAENNAMLEPALMNLEQAAPACVAKKACRKKSPVESEEGPTMSELHKTFTKKAEVRKHVETKMKPKKEAEQPVKEQAERKTKKEADWIAKLEALQEAARKAEEAARKAKESVALSERLAHEEAERLAKEETELKAKEEAEWLAWTKKDSKAKGEAKCRATEEAEQFAEEEAQPNVKEGAEWLAWEAKERKAEEEGERKSVQEARFVAMEHAELKPREIADWFRKLKGEAERVAEEEVEHQAKKERTNINDHISIHMKKAERAVREEAERLAWPLAMQEAKLKAKNNAEHLANSEEERKELEEAEQLTKEEGLHHHSGYEAGDEASSLSEVTEHIEESEWLVMTKVDLKAKDQSSITKMFQDANKKSIAIMGYMTALVYSLCAS